MDYEQRFSAIEKRLDTLDVTVREVRSEAKSHFRWLAGIILSVIFTLVAILCMIDQRQESWIQHSMSQIHSSTQSQLDRNNAANRDLLEQIDRRNSEQNINMRRQLDRIERQLE